MIKQLGFLDEDNRLDRLSKLGDALEKLGAAVDFEFFRPVLNSIFANVEKDESKGGRPPLDFVLMFKILILQQMYNIADDRTEYLINDRLSFQRFLGLTLSSKVPDAKTIWLFRDTLTKSGREKELFDLFNERLSGEGIITRKGSIVDATFVDVPRQRNTRTQNQEIKEGKIPQEWQGDDKKSKNTLAQKDTDARWAKKGNETHYGYKDHVKIDSDSKMIVTCKVTDASVHDSQTIVDLLDDKDELVSADSAYVGAELEKEIRAKLDDEEKDKKVELRINEKGYRNRPLTDEQKASNREKSRIRARVEHVFGHMTNSMGGTSVRAVSKARATTSIMLKNLAYNVNRFAFLFRSKKLQAIS